MIRNNLARYASILAAAAIAAAVQARAQQVANPPTTTTSGTTTAPAPTAATTNEADEEIVKLTPFEVSAGSEQGYNAATTLAGNRLNTDLRDIGNAVSVVTRQFLRDTGAVDNQSLLQYLPGGEVGNINGNFAGTGDGAVLDESGRFVNPNQNTRVRGLTSADNTRDYFLTNIPWDGYNIDRVDFQRGPNSILFGQGSTAGIINAGTQPASFKNSGELELRLGSYGSTRQVLNINRALIPNQLALRVALLRNDQEYKQEPAYSLDKRLFAALRYEPSFMNRGWARTVMRANIEFGDINSNNPRTLPPIDRITPWFRTGTYQGTRLNGTTVTYNNLNRETFGPAQLQDDNTGRANHGQTRPSINGGPNAGTPNPAYNPWVGNFGQQFGSPMMFFSDASASPTAWMQEPRTTRGIGTNGQIDKSLAIAFTRPGSIADYATYAKNAGLPFSRSGVYKDFSLTDPSIFNFYENMMDGPNKREWQNFRTYNLSLAETFLDDQLGFEGVYNNEWWKGGREALLSGDRQAIYIDFMSIYANGSPEGKNGEPFANGTANPNVGRPFLSDSAQGSNNQSITNRESGRFTAFARHDFARDGWMPRVLGDILGQHTITGLLAEDRQSSDYRQWQRWTTDRSYDNFLNDQTLGFNANERTPSAVIYLGPSLINRTTAVGANIPRVMNTVTMPSTVQLNTFSDVWNHSLTPGAAGYVDPNGLWNNAYYTSDRNEYVSTQSENPANYVGWTQYPLSILDANTSQAVRDQLTANASLSKQVVKSKALVWQSHLWHNFLVGTVGWREDKASSWAFSTDTNRSTLTDRQLNLSPSFYKLSEAPNTQITVRSTSWGVVGHLTDAFKNNWPIRISAYYSKSENFQPFSQRVDVYGHPIGAPSGKTTDKGILLETRDGKYSLKINRYVTEAKDQSSSGLGGAWFIGASQGWAGNWANRFEFNWTSDTISGVVPNPDPNNSMYNYAPAPGETLADAQKREANVIAAWRAWQKSVNPDFYKAWSMNLNDQTKSIGASNPNGFSVTEDSVSKGYEIELNAQPTRNWRLSFNASKTDASRMNVGGAGLTDFITKYETALKTTPAGDLRIWWGGSGNETTLQQWNANIGSEYHQRKLQEGTNVPELRRWRWNLVTNYDFDQGMLKGFGVGGGVRWQSNVVIGYRPIYVDSTKPLTSDVTFDIANPYRGPAETDIDLWASYRRRLTDKIDWSIQLNIRNAFANDKLIPITTQPDGTVAGYRIKGEQQWSLSNTFRF